MTNSLAAIHANIWPWPEHELFDKRKSIAASMMMVMIGVALTFVVPTFATEIVRDRKVCHVYIAKQ